MPASHRRRRTPCICRGTFSLDADCGTSRSRRISAPPSGDATSVRKGIDHLQSLREDMIKAKVPYWPQQADIQIKIASAWAVFAEGNKQEALKLMREGADMEDASEKHPVTPGHVVPARELLGDMLLELK